ncbi:adenosine deaminase [Thalassotalea piscium]|uniref:adenosine deaminase n=1 Tax=Thalassotalea piscium TaxID=1230533 RepID=A0A7X0TTG8_9GAMM|nr:adenosine deaminase [Thalassotalea piscium]MBB6543242.1 adenosine deaminase [Thalassotalea piscium]
MIATNIPFVDLHRHLDGNIRPSTVLALAQQHNIPLPADNLNELLPHVQIQGKESNLVSFLQKLDYGVSVLASLDACKRVAYENVQDAYLQGLHYAELRFSPYYMAMTHKLSMKDVVAAVIDGVQLATQEFPVQINLIGILSRTFGVQACFSELQALLYFKDDLVGIDLAGDELGKPGTLFVDHFKQVYDSGLHITIHAGEADGVASIYQAIDQLHATRIGHGTNAINDERLMDYMLDKNIAIESCLTSNYQTGTITDISQHPVKTFLSKGLLVCLNSDDPAVQGCDIKYEYQHAALAAGLSAAQCRKLQENALDMAFISNAKKVMLKQQCREK